MKQFVFSEDELKATFQVAWQHGFVWGAECELPEIPTWENQSELTDMSMTYMDFGKVIAGEAPMVPYKLTFSQRKEPKPSNWHAYLIGMAIGALAVAYFLGN